MLQKFKNILKKFLPMPASSLHSQLQAVLMEMSRLKAENAQDISIAENKEIRQEQDIDLKDIKQLTRAVRSEQRYKTISYYESFEYKYYKDTFINGFMQIPDFYNRFLKLVNGLDDDDIKTVTQIFQRMEKIYQRNEPARLDLFSMEEQEQLRKMQDEFGTFIDKGLQIGENIFFHKGYLLPKNHFIASVLYYRNGLEYVQDINTLRNRDIIDAGAFIGDSALILSPLTNKTVYSFEPAPENYASIERTIELNSLTNVKPVKMALCEKRSTLIFNIPKGSGMSNSIVRNEEIYDYVDHFEVQGISLDEFVDENNLDVGLIKSDLEGAEQLFLQGAINTIKRCKPILIISIYHTISDFLDIKPWIEELDLGYTFKIHRPIEGQILIETVLVASPPVKS